jgi:hypothetical protein
MFLAPYMVLAAKYRSKLMEMNFFIGAPSAQASAASITRFVLETKYYDLLFFLGRLLFSKLNIIFSFLKSTKKDLYINKFYEFFYWSAFGASEYHDLSVEKILNMLWCKKDKKNKAFIIFYTKSFRVELTILLFNQFQVTF